MGCASITTAPRTQNHTGWATGPSRRVAVGHRGEDRPGPRIGLRQAARCRECFHTLPSSSRRLAPRRSRRARSSCNHCSPPPRCRRTMQVKAVVGCRRRDWQRGHSVWRRRSRSASTAPCPVRRHRHRFALLDEGDALSSRDAVHGGRYRAGPAIAGPSGPAPVRRLVDRRRGQPWSRLPPPPPSPRSLTRSVPLRCMLTGRATTFVRPTAVACTLWAGQDGMPVFSRLPAL